MTGQITNALPQENEAQIIGRAANKCFHANIPLSWRATSTDGDEDCGYDFQIQTVDTAQVKDIFRVQLKGKTSPDLNADKTHYSVSLDISTVNYYARATEPVLLVLSDLSVDASPKNCHLYYQWIHEELARLRDRNISERQKTVTLYVPLANRLSETTDLSEDLDKFRKLSNIGQQLDAVVKKTKPNLSPFERTEITQRIVPGIERRSGSLFDALTDDIESSWIDAPEGTIPWFLLEAKSLLRTGQVREAQKALDSAAKLLEGAKPLEVADYWNVIGRLRSFELKEYEASEAFDSACKITDDSERHLIPWAEATLRVRFRTDEFCDFSDVLERLKSNSPKVISMRARLMAAEGRYEDAIAEIQSIEGMEMLIAKAIIISMQAKWEDLLSTCDHALVQSPIRENAKQLFLILRARAKFFLAIGDDASSYSNKVLPLSGPVGTNLTLLRNSWIDIATAITSLRHSGWPSNVELLCDIWSETASILGLQKSTIPLLEEAADARPSIALLQVALEALSVQTGNLKIALQANERQESNPEVILRRTVLLNQLGRHKDCIELFERVCDSTSTDLPIFGAAISLAILSADRIVRPDIADKWILKMKTLENLAPHLALLKYFRTVSQQLLAKDDALDVLYTEYKTLGLPLLLAKHLFHELDASNINQAKRCIEVSEVLKESQLLDIDDNLHLAQALIKLEKWKDLLALTNQALNQFEGNDRLHAIAAFALDKLGQTAEALDKLKSLIQKPDPDHVALNTYINIASISGFSADAIRCVESVLEQETERERQIACLRHLFSLIHLSDPSNPRLLDIAWTIGQKTNRLDETEEGLFLMAIFAATMTSDTDLSEEKSIEFNQRMDAFERSFPDSKIIKRATLPNESSPEDILRILKKVVGINEDRIRWRNKIQTQLKQGELPIPFSWRPRLVLESIPDLPTLWEASKRSSWADRQLHLTMASNDWSEVSLEKMRGQIPLLDLTTLLILNDLDLFDCVFKIFPRIAIGKATLIELQQLLSPMSGSIFRTKCIRLQENLKAHFNEIEQPSFTLHTENNASAERVCSEEITEIIKQRDYMVYSDDALIRVYVNPPKDNPPSICTLDLLIAADNARILTAKNVAECIATLCSWKVGIQIPIRYQLAILPDQLGSVSNVSKGIDLLRNDKLCNAMFSGIWEFGKPFDMLLSHAGSMISELIRDPMNSISSIQALAGFWLSKTKLHPKAPTPAINLIAYLIVTVALIRIMDDSTSSRLWTIYRGLTELEYGERMDDISYRESIITLGKVTAIIEFQLGHSSKNSLNQQLVKGLTQGTSDYDLYSKSYSDELIKQVNKIE